MNDIKTSWIKTWKDRRHKLAENTTWYLSTKHMKDLLIWIIHLHFMLHSISHTILVSSSQTTPPIFSHSSFIHIYTCLIILFSQLFSISINCQKKKKNVNLWYLILKSAHLFTDHSTGVQVRVETTAIQVLRCIGVQLRLLTKRAVVPTNWEKRLLELTGPDYDAPRHGRKAKSRTGVAQQKKIQTLF